jgi:hypothetical protein
LPGSHRTLQRRSSDADDLTVSIDTDAGHSLRPRASLEASEESAQVGTDHVLVRIAGGRYAIAATDVAEVVPLLELTDCPGRRPGSLG